MGIERVISLMPDKGYKNPPLIFIATLGKEAEKVAFNLIAQLRDKGIKSEMGYDGRSLKSQMRRADKLGVRYTLIIGEDEIEKGRAILRDMVDKAQEEIDLDSIKDVIIRKSLKCNEL